MSESGEDKREFAKKIKQDWLEFDLCSQWFECRMIPCAEPGAGHGYLASMSTDTVVFLNPQFGALENFHFFTALRNT